MKNATGNSTKLLNTISGVDLLMCHVETYKYYKVLATIIKIF